MLLLFGALGSCFEAAFKRIGQKRNCGVYASVFLQKKENPNKSIHYLFESSKRICVKDEVYFF